jgi:integrase
MVLKMSEIHRSRFRIAGRKYSPEEYYPALDKAITDRIKLGVKSPDVIGQQLGKSGDQIRRRIKELADAGKVKLTESGRVEQTEQQAQAAEYSKLAFDDFVQNSPSVKRWVDDLLVRKDGKPLAQWRELVQHLKVFCDTLKANPDSLVVSREAAEDFYKSFVIEFRKSSTANPHKYKMALRNYAMSNGIVWARGVSGLMSGKKIHFGQYAHIKLTDAQVKRGIDIASAWGDFELRDWFAIGCELGPRHLALRDMQVNTLEAHDGFLTMRAFESKTDKTWTKYIVDPQVQQIVLQRVEKQKAEGKTKLFQNHVGESEFSRSINTRLKKLYTALGATDPYFQAHPSHAMRHVAAHHWLGLSKYNYSLVAKILGWEDENTLRKCYGEMPGEVLLDALKDARKRMV